MSIKGDGVPVWVKYLAKTVKVVGAAIFFFLIPVAVARNMYGIGDKLSAFPGIANGGGVVSGLVAAIYILGTVAIVAGGGIAATGGDVPYLDGSEQPEPASTTTAMPTPTPTETVIPTTLTPTQTPTATPSAKGRRQMQLDAFREDYLNRLKRTMENESLTGVPVLGSEYRETDDGTLELWVIFWECDFTDEENTQWLAAGDVFPGTVGMHDGAQPNRLRIYGVTNLTHWQDEITYINTSDAALAYNGTLDPDSYTENWWDRRREPSQLENETAYQIAINGSGQEVADMAFYVDHADNDKASCNGGAKPGLGNEHRNEHEENTNAIGLGPTVGAGIAAGIAVRPS